jgi:hypothetical protein
MKHRTVDSWQISVGKFLPAAFAIAYYGVSLNHLKSVTTTGYKLYNYA